VGRARREQRDKVTFRCGNTSCAYRQFSAVPARIEPFPEQEFHPWEYFAPCPSCGNEAEQAAWERNLMKAHAAATGPKTAGGKAIVAKNLEGHPTPEESQRTRFNAMKHGLYARATKYFPARPGKYQACEDCRFLGNGCGEISDVCLSRVEVFMRYDIAYSQRNPELLRQDDADLQASVRVIVNEIILSIARRGVEWETPEWYYDKDGDFHLAEGFDKEGRHYVLKKVETHPLLKPLIELIKANGMTMPHHGMTAKSVDEDDLLRGQLAREEDERETALAFRERATRALEGLGDLIRRSQQRMSADPVLAEYAADETAIEGEVLSRDDDHG
jgi:hypothetical protein